MARLLASLLFAACLQCSIASFAAPANLDVDGPIQGESRFRETMSCILASDDYQLCDSHTVTIKYITWRLLEKGCDNCTDDEKKVYRFLAHVSNNKPTEWTQILNKFDPSGQYKEKNSNQWKQYGIKV